MKKSLQQIATLTIIGLLVFSAMGIITPPQAHAQLATIDAGDIVQNTLSAIENGVTSVSTEYLQLKSSVFDAIATAIAKQILMQITLSVVNWINSGFKGSPAFVQNPGKFFENIGDQVAGNFLAANSDLATSLCSPFNIDVRVALALQISGGSGISGVSQYSCSLSTMINNATNAVKGASINGFTAGDFRQGGWPAFVALTTVPANSPNGAYLQAQANLSVKIGNQQSMKQAQLAQGNGFLSWTTCTPDPDWPFDADDPTNDGSGQDCEVQTPGSAISNALNKHLDVPTENLELANDMNAIINALFSQLVVQVLGNGLTSVSKPNTSGATYLQQIANSVTTQVQTLESRLKKTLGPYVTNTKTIANNTDTALAVATAAQNTLDEASQCYASIIANASSTPYVSATTITYAQNQINQIQLILGSTGTTSSLVAQLTLDDQTADANMETYDGFSATISSAKNASDLGTTSQELQVISESGTLPDATQVLASKNQLAGVEAEITPIQADANSRLAACQAFSATTTPTGANPIPIVGI